MNEIRKVFSSEILWNEIDRLNNDKVPLYKYVIKYLKPREKLVIITKNTRSDPSEFKVEKLITTPVIFGLTGDNLSILLSEEYKINKNGYFLLAPVEGRSVDPNIYLDFIYAYNLNSPYAKLDIIEHAVPHGEILNLVDAAAFLCISEIFWKPKITVRVHADLSEKKTALVDDKGTVRPFFNAYYFIKDYHFESPKAIMGWHHIFMEAEFLRIYSPDLGENIVLEIIADRDITKKFLGKDNLQLARQLFEEDFYLSASSKNLRIIW